MATVSWYGRPLSNVFGLLGNHEPALTRALGWTLGRSPNLMQATLDLLDLDPDTPDDDIVVLLEAADELGRTDIEIRTPTAHAIIEAKVGWIVPDEVQLSAYAPRFSDTGEASGVETAQRLVTLSDSSPQWAAHTLPQHVAGTPVTHWSWDVVRELITTAKAAARGLERTWLDQMEDYMGAATSSRLVTDSLVYCVVISDDIFGEVKRPRFDAAPV